MIFEWKATQFFACFNQNIKKFYTFRLEVERLIYSRFCTIMLCILTRCVECILYSIFMQQMHALVAPNYVYMCELEVVGRFILPSGENSGITNALASGRIYRYGGFVYTARVRCTGARQESSPLQPGHLNAERVEWEDETTRNLYRELDGREHCQKT